MIYVRFIVFLAKQKKLKLQNYKKRKKPANFLPVFLKSVKSVS